MVTFSTTSAEPTVIKRESINDKADSVKPTPKKKKKQNEKEAARDNNDNSTTTTTTTTNSSDTEITTKASKQQDDEKSTGVMYIFPHEKMQLNQANWYPHRLQGNSNWIAIGGNSGLLHLKLVQMQ